MKYLVDTSVFIHHARGTAAATAFLTSHRDSVFVSYLVLGELLQGVKNTKHAQFVQEIQSLFPIIWSSRSLEQHALELLRQHAPRGLTLSVALIASSAIEQQLTLVTHNTKHFKMIPHLKLTTPVV